MTLQEIINRLTDPNQAEPEGAELTTLLARICEVLHQQADFVHHLQNRVDELEPGRSELNNDNSEFPPVV